MVPLGNHDGVTYFKSADKRFLIVLTEGIENRPRDVLIPRKWGVFGGTHDSPP
jgi:hypothetical protein